MKAVRALAFAFLAISAASVALATPGDFIRGPIVVTRDSPGNLQVGFTVRDGNYLSARWAGDAHRFSSKFASMLEV